MTLKPVLCLMSMLLAAPSAAQDLGAAPEPGLGSAYAYAKSGAKAAHAKDLAQSGARVIGGQRADPGEWPWQVALLVAGYGISPDTQFCGGSMILDTWVLTAAHCVFDTAADGSKVPTSSEGIAVLVGATVLAAGQGEAIGADAIFVHPDYNPEEFDNDIALIRLARVPVVPYATVTVPDAEFGDILDQPGVISYVTGWGLVEGGDHPADMHETEIQMLSRAQCNDAMIEARADEAAKGFSYAVDTFGLSDADAQSAWEELLARVPEPMSVNMICSGTYEGGKTACQGDSGGPLVVPLDDGSFVQAGVVSWGLSAGPSQTCDETALFSAYTRISNYVGWLEQTIAANP